MSYALTTAGSDTGCAERKLPQELCDHIIDHLWDDPITLKACSLVCAGWAPTTRLHLFRTIRVSPDRAGLEPDVLSSSLVDVVPYIHELILDHGDQLFPRPAFPQWAKRLRNVESLTVQYSGVNLMEDAYRADLIASFPKLKALKLHSVVFAGWWEVWQLLGAYPALSTVHVVDGIRGSSLWSTSSALPGPVAMPRGMPKSSQIQELVLQTGLFDGLMEWLVKSPTGSKLRTLDLKKTSYTVDPGTMELLEAAMPSLENLRISWSTLDYLLHVHRDRFLAFLHGSRLHTFHVYDLYLCFDFRGGFPHFLYWLPSVISRLNPVRLEKIALSINIRTMNSLEAMGWSLFDTVFIQLLQQQPQLTAAIEVTQEPSWNRGGTSMMALPIVDRILQGLANSRRDGMRVDVVPVDKDVRCRPNWLQVIPR